MNRRQFLAGAASAAAAGVAAALLAADGASTDHRPGHRPHRTTTTSSSSTSSTTLTPTSAPTTVAGADEVYVAGVLTQPHEFGVDGAGQPYWQQGGANPGEAAALSVDAGRPYLLTA